MLSRKAASAKLKLFTVTSHGAAADTRRQSQLTIRLRNTSLAKQPSDNTSFIEHDDASRRCTRNKETAALANAAQPKWQEATRCN